MFSAQIVKAQEFICADWTEFKPYPTLPDSIDVCQIGEKEVTPLSKDLETLIRNILKYVILY